MTQYIVRRLLLLIPVVWLVTLALFVIIRKTPGDPLQIEFGQEFAPEQIAAKKAELGLDRPIAVQYVDWLGRTLRGDFGRSIRAKRPVSIEIKERLPATLELAALAFLIGLAVALPLGAYVAVRPASLVAKLTTSFTLASVALPGFFVSTMLVFLFTYKFRLVETPHYTPFLEDPVTNLRNIILPAIAISHGTVAMFTRYIRAGVRDVLNQDYIRTAHAKGLTEWSVVLEHVLRNALIPAVTLIGLAIPTLWEGALITERIFNWPGVGRLSFTALTNQDYPVVQTVVLFAAISVVLGNLLVDIAYAYIDPRINFGSR